MNEWVEGGSFNIDNILGKILLFFNLFSRLLMIFIIYSLRNY